MVRAGHAGTVNVGALAILFGNLFPNRFWLACPPFLRPIPYRLHLGPDFGDALFKQALGSGFLAGVQVAATAYPDPPSPVRTRHKRSWHIYSGLCGPESKTVEFGMDARDDEPRLLIFAPPAGDGDPEHAPDQGDRDAIRCPHCGEPVIVAVELIAVRPNPAA